MANARGTKKPDTRLIVRITSENSFGDPYLKLETEVVYWDDQDGHWVSCYGYSTPQALRGFEKLGVTAQADKYKAELYGGEVRYRDLYSASLDDVKLMAATITRVCRKLDKLRDEFGWPQSVRDQIVRFAKTVPCTGSRVFGFYDKNSPMQDGQGYVWLDADGLDYRIKKAQAEFAEKYNIKRQEEA